jgi:hypothetical protein
MGRLDELQRSVEEMSYEELLEKVRSIRADRKVSKRAQRTTTKKSRVKKKESIKEMLKGMSPEEIKALLGGE